MSKLSQLVGKGKVIELGGVELTIKPLTTDDLDLFTVKPDSPQEEQMRQTKRLIHKVLKDAVPDATEEEINTISVEYLVELMECIAEVNGMNLTNLDKIGKLRNVSR